MFTAFHAAWPAKATASTHTYEMRIRRDGRTTTRYVQADSERHACERPELAEFELLSCRCVQVLMRPR